MPTKTHQSSWIRRLKARLLDGPEMDQALDEAYRWARQQRMSTGVRKPGLRDASTVTGEADAPCRTDRPSDPELPRVVIEEQAPEEREPLEQVLERELARAERRRQPRVPLRRLVRYSDGELFATGELIDVSASGLQIRGEVPLPLGSMVAGAFRPDESKPGSAVGFRGHVVRQVEDRDGCRMGIQISRLVTAHRQEVEQIIDRLARKPRRDPTLLGWKASG